MTNVEAEDDYCVLVYDCGDEAGKVQTLDLGADDYVTKPFGMEEPLTRMRTALRHQLQVHGERPVFREGDLSIVLVRRIVKLRDQEVKLSPNEYDRLRVRFQYAGKVLAHRFAASVVMGRIERNTCALTCASFARRSRAIRSARSIF